MKALKQYKYDSIALEDAYVDNLERFRLNVLSGLSSNPKRLSSKYFYDKKGDELPVQLESTMGNSW